ncbi:unnamed protein product [Euphydryas editha]|uniref:Serine protease K12H4.7 n=1 Tax=Euphydryas editha TaxID=104508 RepID=A0AAU9USN9_EUPED|nr:unnamed protein product [Euphydryas editha]
MYLKYCQLLLLFSVSLADGFGFFDIGNTFNYLNKELYSLASNWDGDVKTRWIKQELDHFDPEEKRTWKMRYFQRLTYWRSNGPIYLLLGGESEASSRWTTTGIMQELAKETKGAMFVSEHRYYGKSKPLNTTDIRNFKFLNSRQATADNAKLLKYIKSWRMFNNSKVVVIGGSYSGNLAAWMRMLYPELVDAALASSAPVLAKKDFYEYLEKVNDNYEQYGTSECLDNIRNTFERYDRLLQSSEGINLLKEEENICQDCDLTVLKNRQVFFSEKVSKFMIYSQYGNTKNIKEHCKKLNTSLKLQILDKTSKPNFWVARKGCYYYDFDKMIEEYKDKENEWVIAWIYQTCTEFGYFQTTSSKSQPFTNNIGLNFYIEMCSVLFGTDFDEKRVDSGIRDTNVFYGGRTPNVTKVVFTNGDLDPWSTLGVLEDLSYNAPAVVIPRSSHCRDLFSNRENDIEELKEARIHIKYLIKNWIGAGDFFSN